MKMRLKRHFLHSKLEIPPNFVPLRKQEADSNPMQKTIFMLMLAVGLVACKKPIVGATSSIERSKLAQLAESKLEPELKYHGVSESLAKILQECTQIADDTDMIAHLRTFLDNNRQYLIQISRQTDDWQKNMSEEDRMFFAIDMINRDYAKKLKTLVPLVQKRINDYPEVRNELQELLRNIEIRR